MLARTLLLAAVVAFPAGAQRETAKKLPVVDRDDIRLVPVLANSEPLNQWIKGIAQDNQGFMWFATYSGLFRYDGYTFKAYRHDPQNPNSLAGEDIRNIYKDRSGHIWIATISNGIDMFDPSQGTFTHYRHRPGVDTSLSSDAINTAYQDRSGTLWVATNGGGLDRLDPSEGTFQHYRYNPQDPTSLSNDGVNFLHEDSHGNFWVGTAVGLNKLDRATGRSIRFFHEQSNPRTLANNNVNRIMEDRSGVLWIGSRPAGGLTTFDQKTGEFTRYSYHTEQRGIHSNSGVIAMLADTAGSLWFSAIDVGLLKLDPERMEFSRYLNGQVDAVFEDAEGEIWIGTRTRGVFRFPKKKSAFVNFEKQGSPSPDLASEIESVGTDSQGYVWMGTSSGLQMFDRKSGKSIFYRHNPQDSSSIPKDPVFAIAEDHSRQLWFGTYGGGLSGFNRETGRFSVYRNDPKDPTSLGRDRILCLLVDHDGILWVGTERFGLSRFVPGTGKFKNYLGTYTNEVSALFEDRSGTLWVGGLNWLGRFDRTSERFIAGDPQPSAISKGWVRSIHEDRRGNLWIGTEDGLLRRNPAGNFTQFSTQDGLPDLYVKAILEDRKGDLWLATHNGLSQFSPDTGRFRNYFVSSGLLSHRFDLLGDAGSVTAMGEILLGSSRGFTLFDPDQVAPNSYVPPVVLTEFLLFNRPVGIGGDSPLQRPIWATNALTLKHDQSIFTLEFAALSYAGPERNHYRYRMEGLEPTWNEVDSTRRSATYIRPAAGNYVFRVQGSNNDLTWNDAGLRLDITVLPPWYATLWFRTALIASVAGLIIMIHRLRTRQLRLTAAQLECQVAERTLELQAAKESAEVAKDAAEASKEAAERANRTKSAFLSHMSHELRTPLNAILGFAGLLREGGLSDKRRAADLNIISRSGEHLLDLINDILDMSKIEAGRTTVEVAPCDLGRLVRDVTNMMRVRAAEKNLELRLIEAPGVPQFVETDRKKLRQMLINLMGNAIKCTERGSVILRLSSQPDANCAHPVLSFEVEDTGIGIAIEDQERIFEPFVQAGNRLRQKGTGLGLAISRQCAVLLGGTLRVTSAPGEGSVFRLELPVKCVEPFVDDPRTERKYILAPEQPEYRVLVVDDNAENQDLLQRLLRQAGFLVQVAGDGPEAIGIFPTWRPHFIWMDLRMAGMDGSEATARIRELEGGKAVKICAVTASESTHSAVGMDDLVHKPYRVKEIFTTMERHLGVRYRTYDLPEPVAPPRMRQESLADLPSELRSDLTNAVASLNVTQIHAVVERVSGVDSELGDALAFHAQRLAFSQIYEALKDCERVE